MEAIQALEFDTVLQRLADLAMSERTKEEARNLRPYHSERECRRRMDETNEARRLLDALGTPPLPSMKEVGGVLEQVEREGMLLPEQLEGVARFLSACKRMKSYLKRAESLNAGLASCGAAIDEMPGLREEIEGCVRRGRVEDNASPALRSVRRRIENAQGEIKGKLDQILRSKKGWFSENSAVMRNGRWVLPVKKQYRGQMGGVVVEVSSAGSTCFIEPSSVARLREEIGLLEAEEDAEVRRILYTLTAMVEEKQKELRWNMEALETLDFAFAKAKLSAEMKAVSPALTTGRRLVIRQGRHPLLNREECVPLDFTAGDGVSGVVITGPNTGGKTVALKTVGLLTMMAQSGLHVPAGAESVFCLCNAFLCDIGDGQSIEQNLSTFSAHITNVISILETATEDSLVLLDELGSGTDPAEGMGIAVAILEELRQRNCLFAVTTHYPEVKEYTAAAEGLVNARMAFDRESLRPLYRLEIGEAGESCALYIAKRLGLPGHMLERAWREAYLPREGRAGTDAGTPQEFPEELRGPDSRPHPSGPSRRAAPRLKREESEKAGPRRSFRMGDSVEVLPGKEVGIVYRPADERGEVCVQVKGKKRLVPWQRLHLLVAAEALYPPDYDFSIVFDTVENRKARHKMGKGNHPELTVTYEDEREWKR